jgi:chromosomal replication initiation ATPase DnaA
MTDQPRLFDRAPEDFSARALILSQSNREAASMLARWREWPGRALALVGAAGAGKTHMAHVWAEANGVRIAPPRADAAQLQDLLTGPARRLVIDPVEELDELALTLVLDMARDGDGALLLTAREPPAAWAAALPDLRSRLVALPTAYLGEPDLALLAGVLRRLCRARFLRLDEDVARYCAERMARSFFAAGALAEAIGRVVVRSNGPISHEIARRALRELVAQQNVEGYDGEEGEPAIASPRDPP